MINEPKYGEDLINKAYLDKAIDQLQLEIDNSSATGDYSKNFGSQPSPPYHVNDTWSDGSDLWICRTERLIGSFNINDWEKSSDYTNDAALNTFISGDYAELKNGVDSIVTLYYQYDDPANEWDTYTKKDIHVGDIWKNISVNPAVEYIYTKTDGEPPTYSWEPASVPAAMFDELDGKKSIYTVKPLSYSLNDVWFIEEGLIDIPDRLQVGDMVVASNSATTFSWDDWNKKDMYIQKNVVDESIAPIERQIGEITNDLDLNTPASKLSKIVQTITDLSASFEIKGGSNLINDSLLILETSNSDKFIKTGDWLVLQNQTISQYTDSKFLTTCTSVTGGSIKWVINVIPNTAYTLSLKYNNSSTNTFTLNLLNGSPNVLINETTEKSYEIYKYGFITNSDVIEIEIVTDTDGGSYSDLILNYGALIDGDVISPNALKWQPAPGENIGANIRLSYEGARFTMLNGTLYHIIDNTGDRIIKVSGGPPVTSFDGEGMTTNKVVANNELQVGIFTTLVIDSENVIEF